MSESRDPPERPQAEVASTPVKLDAVRNISGGTLLRAIPGQQARFMMATPVQSSTAIISSTTTIQTQILPKVTAPGTTPGTTVTRINSLPIQATSATNYHVPRGAAAVANIAVPRSSVATPIVRAPANLQTTIGVTQQHAMSRSVLSVAPWVGVTNLAAGQVTSRPPVQQIRTTPMTGGAKVTVSGHIKPLTDGQPRPVLLHTTTHKHVTLTQQTQVQVQVGDKAVIKGYTGAAGGATPSSGSAPGPATNQATRLVAPSTPALSRITNPLPPMVSIHPAVLVQGPQPHQATLKAATAVQPKVITQPVHGSTTMQISSLPVSSVPPSAIAISTVVTRPVMIASGSQVVASAAAGIPRATTPKVYQGAQAEGPQTTPVYIQTQPHKPAQGSPVTSTTVVSLSNPVYSLPHCSTTTYDNYTFQMGVARPPTTAITTTTSSQQQTTSQAVRTTPNLQGIVGTTQPVRFNSVMTMVVDPSRTHTITPQSSEGSAQPLNTLENSSVSSLAATLAQSLTPKQNTSPRPSILRKRDPEGSPMKAQKNLTPVLSNLSVSTGGSSPPPSPPKRPESAGNSGQSSGGSTTISATSSPGDSPPIKPETPSSQPIEEERERPPPPTEMSPRKKPRKQQLTGNQISEPTFSDDDMEFISEEKIKKEFKEEPMEEDKIIPRRTMSLLSAYKHPWKSRNNHFYRYTDVKPKEERKPTISELANQKQALQKLNGWKIYHLGSQMEDMVNSETEFFGLFNSLLSFLEVKQRLCKNKDFDNDLNRINERIKANFQRSKVVKDQMQEAKGQVMKLFNHKSYVSDIISKNMTKRSLKKRERV